MITISLAQIEAHDPCDDGWATLLESKSGTPEDEQFPMVDILDSNGLDYVLGGY